MINVAVLILPMALHMCLAGPPRRSRVGDGEVRDGLEEGRRAFEGPGGVSRGRRERGGGAYPEAIKPGWAGRGLGATRSV